MFTAVKRKVKRKKISNVRKGKMYSFSQIHQCWKKLGAIAPCRNSCKSLNVQRDLYYSSEESNVFRLSSSAAGT